MSDESVTVFQKTDTDMNMAGRNPSNTQHLLSLHQSVHCRNERTNGQANNQLDEQSFRITSPTATMKIKKQPYEQRWHS